LLSEEGKQIGPAGLEERHAMSMTRGAGLRLSRSASPWIHQVHGLRLTQKPKILKIVAGTG
jgi:hypothetical protein